MSIALDRELGPLLYAPKWVRDERRVQELIEEIQKLTEFRPTIAHAAINCRRRGHAALARAGPDARSLGSQLEHCDTSRPKGMAGGE
jgi:uncharacterized SAM-dependent methyltransferase